jgi:hypothetical protein
MGRIFCSITGDTVGWHDTVGGNLDDRTMHGRWGKKSYQGFHNDWTLSGHHSFLVELAKYGLDHRDMAANVNWFSRVTVDGDGNLIFDPGNSKAGAGVSLRFEMDTLVVLHTCPHPMNTAREYPKRPVKIQIRKAAPVTGEDECMNSRPENRRGFQNNAVYHLTGGCTHDR